MHVTAVTIKTFIMLKHLEDNRPSSSVRFDGSLWTTELDHFGLKFTTEPFGKAVFEVKRDLSAPHPTLQITKGVHAWVHACAEGPFAAMMIQTT